MPPPTASCSAPAACILAALAVAVLCANNVVAETGARLQGASWTHGWDTPAAAWWGYGAMNGGLYTDEQVAFVAKTYRVVVLSLCASPAQNTSVADGISGVAARLKAANPAVRVLQYFNVHQFACYPPTDPLLVEFEAHPQWWLRDDKGVPVGKPVSAGGTGYQYDYSNADAVQHWLQMPLGQPGGKPVLDGFLLDGGAGYDDPPGIAPARAETLKQARWRAIGRMQKRLTEACGGLVVANGMIGGVQDPTADDP